MEKVTITVTVNASIDKVWNAWTRPNHIIHWNFATPEWHCPEAENDCKPGGVFRWRMEAKDGSMGFDFDGLYSQVIDHEYILKEIADGRKVEVMFKETEEGVVVTETFDVEDENTLDMQRQGWQAILGNFKKYAESI